jgi:CHAT domain-containing protein
MARKRFLFFSELYAVLKHAGYRWRKLCYGLLTIVTALLLLYPAQALQPAGFSESVSPPTATTAIKDSLAQGKTLYDAGQYLEASKILRQALQGYAKGGDRTYQAALWSNLSLTEQQLGQWPDAAQSITEALNLLQDKTDRAPSLQHNQVLAQSLDIQGRLQFSLGKLEEARQTWVQTASLYQTLNDPTGKVRSQINQAKALQALGLYRRALSDLKQVQVTLQTQPDSLTKLAGLRSLGEVLQLVGEFDQSKKVLTQSLDLAQRLESSSEQSYAYLSLGNTARSQEKFQEALSYYHKASTVNPSASHPVNAQLNALSLLIQQEQIPEAQNLWPQIQSQLSALPLSRTKTNAQINLAQSLLKLSTYSTPSALATVKQTLDNTLQEAQTLGDVRSQAYALGALGEWSEQVQQIPQAQALTQQALSLAQPLNSPELTYRLQWQSGRLYKRQGNNASAIVAYGESVAALQSVQRDLAAFNKDLQFSFREGVEPVYREYVALLLESDGNNPPSQTNLKTARETLDALQTAEIANFLRVNCLETHTVLIDDVTQKTDPTAAILYPIIFGNRIDVILKIPQQPNLLHYSTSFSTKQLEATVERFQQALLQSNNSPAEFLRPAQKLYDVLIRPAEPYLNNGTIKTLVFVQDGVLRNIPMAALHDGKRFLIEKQSFSIALTPGLKLLEPQTIKQRRPKTLIAGLSKSPSPQFSALPYVDLELKQIQSHLPSTQLLNQAFTRKAFQTKVALEPLSIVHLATHGQFSSKADQTFVLAWDDKINVNQLSNLLETSDRYKKTPLELLVLSACETLAGDKKAALGLAGVAVKSGARSTLASLWGVDDRATATLMEQFYLRLTQGTYSKALALSEAQRYLLQHSDFKHPYYWAPYVLVGNWL